MRAREMHPLCCISVDSPGAGGDGGSRSPLPPEADLAVGERPHSGSNDGSEAGVAGLLYKWTNYGRGWRCRWFTLRGGVLSYSKIRSPRQLAMDGEGVRLIGDPSLCLNRVEGGGGGGGRKPPKPVGVIRPKDVNMESETSGVNERLQLMKNGFSDSGHGKYSVARLKLVACICAS